MITSLSKQELKRLNQLLEKVTFEAEDLTKFTQQAETTKRQVFDLGCFQVSVGSEGGMVLIQIPCPQ